MRSFMLIRSAFAVVAMTTIASAQVPRWIPDPSSQLLPAPVPATVKDGFRLVTLGDLLYWRPVRPQIDSGMEAALRIVRDADFATANLEGTFFDLRTRRIPPRGGGILMVGAPDLAEDIKNLGVRLVSKANNHTVDWGTTGMNENRRLLEAAGLPYAGVGDNRQSARAATFVDLQKGRVAVVSAASSFPPGSIPMDEDAEIRRVPASASCARQACTPSPRRRWRCSSGWIRSARPLAYRSPERWRSRWARLGGVRRASGDHRPRPDLSARPEVGLDLDDESARPFLRS
jgi:hypothetical protein